MMRSVTGALMMMSLLSVSEVNAQSAQKSAQINRLSFFVGTWSESGSMRDDPAKPMRAISGGETCKWSAGGYAVVCEEKTSGAGGGWEGVYILSYEAGAGKYHVYGTEKPGANMHAVGKLVGDRWEWLTEAAPDGSRVRYVFAPAGAKARTMVVEVQSGNKWARIVENKYTLIK